MQEPQETWVQSLGYEDPLEKEKATHSSILAWRIPWTEESGGLQSKGSQSWRQLKWHSKHSWILLKHGFRVSLMLPGDAGGKEPPSQCRRCKTCGFDPWIRKIPWRRAWQPTLLFLPGKSHGHWNLVSYSPWGCKQSWLKQLNRQAHLSQRRE